MYGNMDKSVRYVCRGTLNKDVIAVILKNTDWTAECPALDGDWVKLYQVQSDGDVILTEMVNSNSRGGCKWMVICKLENNK